MAQFEGWAPEILSLVHEGGDTITPRLLYTLPAGHKWTCQRGVTLLGDAAHLMTPFGGNGVNFAMLDAAVTGDRDRRARRRRFDRGL